MFHRVRLRQARDKYLHKPTGHFHAAAGSEEQRFPPPSDLMEEGLEAMIWKGQEH